MQIVEERAQIRVRGKRLVYVEEFSRMQHKCSKIGGIHYVSFVCRVIQLQATARNLEPLLGVHDTDEVDYCLEQII